MNSFTSSLLKVVAKLALQKCGIPALKNSSDCAINSRVFQTPRAISKYPRIVLRDDHLISIRIYHQIRVVAHQNYLPKLLDATKYIDQLFNDEFVVKVIFWLVKNQRLCKCLCGY